MRHIARTPARSFLLTSVIIIAVVVGVGIPLGLTGTYEQPSWMPRGTGIDMLDPNANVFSPEMVIITSSALRSTLEPLAQWKTQKGTPCIVNTTDEIYAKYTSGRDNAENIRNYLKDLYANTSLKWVLLGGDHNVVPMRYVFNDDTMHYGNPSDETDGSSFYDKPTDFYYSDLTGDWDTDGDSNFGESASNSGTGLDEVNWTPDVYVGRFPTSDQGRLQDLVNKTLNYEKNPLNATWMNDFLLGGAVADVTPYNDEGLLVQNISKSYVPSSMDVTLCLRSANNLTSGFEPAFDAGTSLVHFQGHGSEYSLANHANAGGSFFYSSDAASLNNQDKPALMFVAACSTGAFDVYSSDTLMETLLFHERGGVIGYIGSMRVDWYFGIQEEIDMNSYLQTLNRGMARLFWKNFFANPSHQPGKALADMKKDYIHSEWYKSGYTSLNMEYERKNLYTYTLWGDPEISIYTKQISTFVNPLPAKVYAGQRLQLSFTDNNTGHIVPGATVCIQSGDFYYTSHMTGDIFDVRLALDPRTYNITITGPNMQPFNTTFTTEFDTIAPLVPVVEEAPPEHVFDLPLITVNHALNFTLRAVDSESGVGAVVIHVSYDNFVTFANFSLAENRVTGKYYASLVNLPPGDIQYYFTVMDYAENITREPAISGSYHNLHIEPLVAHYGIVFLGVGAALLMGIAISASVIKKWRVWKNLV